jgi:hypothetical protein
MKVKIVQFLFLSMAWMSIVRVHGQNLTPKVSHAEPVYFDLIRDLGARKGERELNIGMGISRHPSYSEYSYLVEYEFAPVNRLGLEIEIPFVFRRYNAPDNSTPSENGLEGIKAALQYSFFVSEKLKTTMAVGYIFERRLTRLNPAYEHNPFFIIAKKWGTQFHCLLYAGPLFEYNSLYRITSAAVINASVHYMLPGTKNFVGVEINDEMKTHHHKLIIRPQFKLTLSPASAIGLALGISTHNNDEPLDFLIRWIYELRKKN